MSKKVTTEDFIKRGRNIHGTTYDYSKSTYARAKDYITIICPKHGEFLQTPNNHINLKHGCPKCAKLELNKCKIYTLDEFITKANNVFNGKYNYDNAIYINSNTKITVKCPEHGIFNPTPKNHLSGSGCPRCNESKGEFIINMFLTEHNIQFDREVRFDECRGKQPLPFDFYIPSTHTLIEFDGIQHFKPLTFWGGVDALKQRQQYDGIKNTFAEKNGYNLIRVPYYDLNNIEHILTKYLL